MLRTLFFVLFWATLLPASYAQIEDYYTPRRKSSPIIFNHPDLIKVDNHWYMGLEGGGKWMGTHLSSSLTGLIGFQKSVIDGYAAAQFGYLHHLKWGIETGYIRNPSRMVLAINSARPFVYRIEDLQHSIPLRFKWRVFRLGRIQKKSGMYVGAGFVWTPTRNRTQINQFDLAGLARVSGSRTQFDTLIVENYAYTTGKAKLEWEGNLEFVGRISQHFEIVAYGRATLAPASSIESRTELFINRISQSTSVASLKPMTYQFGITFRYLYGFMNTYRSAYEE